MLIQEYQQQIKAMQTILMACYAQSGTYCDYCCLIDKVECTRDIRACDPVYERNTMNMYVMIIMVGSVICGCPLLVLCMKLMIDLRFCKSYYKSTNGITCLEFIVRYLCFCCCKFHKINRKIKSQDQLFEQAFQSRVISGVFEDNQDVKQQKMNGQERVESEDNEKVGLINNRKKEEQKCDIELMEFANKGRNMTSQQIDNIYKDDLYDGGVIQTDIITTPGRDYDFDQINEENMTYSRYGGAQHQQQSQNIMNEDIDPKQAMNTFNEIATEHSKERFQLKRSRQAQISSRLLKLKEELYRLEKELTKPKESTDPLAAAEGEGDQKIKQEAIAAKNQLAQLNQLKEKMQQIYKSKGFQILTDKQQQLKFLQQANKAGKDEVDVADLEKILLKLQKQKLTEGNDTVTLVMDRKKQDVGLLIRLYHLQKRLNFIKYVIGEWKPTSKYKTMTEQIEYVQKRMELLDPQKLHYLQSRTKMLNDDILNLQSNMQEVKEIGHDKEQVEELYGSAIKVKQTMESIQMFVDRLEQKRKIHDMSAKVLIDIEAVDEQQSNIIRSTKENKQLLEYIQEGMKDNLDTIKKNIAYLKQKTNKQS